MPDRNPNTAWKRRTRSISGSSSSSSSPISVFTLTAFCCGASRPRKTSSHARRAGATDLRRTGANAVLTGIRSGRELQTACESHLYVPRTEERVACLKCLRCLGLHRRRTGSWHYLAKSVSPTDFFWPAGTGMDATFWRRHIGIGQRRVWPISANPQPEELECLISSMACWRAFSRRPR
jgi:hypothetical protein